jgi:hypothetical protein
MRQSETVFAFFHAGLFPGTGSGDGLPKRILYFPRSILPESQIHALDPTNQGNQDPAKQRWHPGTHRRLRFGDEGEPALAPNREAARLDRHSRRAVVPLRSGLRAPRAVLSRAGRLAASPSRQMESLLRFMDLVQSQSGGTAGGHRKNHSGVWAGGLFLISSEVRGMPEFFSRVWISST